MYVLQINILMWRHIILIFHMKKSNEIRKIRNQFDQNLTRLIIKILKSMMKTSCQILINNIDS